MKDGGRAEKWFTVENLKANGCRRVERRNVSPSARWTITWAKQRNKAGKRWTRSDGSEKKW